MEMDNNVKTIMMKDNVKTMIMEDNVKPGARDKPPEARDRGHPPEVEYDAFHRSKLPGMGEVCVFDLSACVAPDNVKLMENNVKMKKMDNNVKKEKEE